jgi:hypothetical protein
MAKRPSKKSAKRPRLHHSFKRSYREDYVRELEVPGIIAHVAASFKLIFKHWKTFLLLIILMVLLNAILVGLMSEDTYTNFQDILEQTNESAGGGPLTTAMKAGLLLVSTMTTGGLNSNMDGAQGVFAAILLLITWLVSTYLFRHYIAGHKVKLRDALYNACTPLISTAAILLLILIQLVPVFIFIILYSTAVQTEFLSTPFYAFVFFIFGAVMILLSGYWLSSSVIALVAVSAPGLYPGKALRAASDLMMSRRIKFIIRLIALLFVVLFLWAIIMIPLIMFDLWMKTFEWTSGIPFIPICLMIMSIFTVIFTSAYIYIYYRWMLDYEEK